MQFKRRLRPEARVDLVPMIDVVFQLVIFFMVTSTFLMTPGINLLLPASTTTEPIVLSNMVITVASSEEIYLNRDRYTLQSFESALSDIDEQQRDQIDSVVIEGDGKVSYDLLVRVLDRLRLYGFQGVSLRLREEKSTTQ